jgi:hypothetical protein
MLYATPFRLFIGNATQPERRVRRPLKTDHEEASDEFLPFDFAPPHVSCVVGGKALERSSRSSTINQKEI